jgi:hypothetical protein
VLLIIELIVSKSCFKVAKKCLVKKLGNGASKNRSSLKSCCAIERYENQDRGLLMS